MHVFQQRFIEQGLYEPRIKQCLVAQALFFFLNLNSKSYRIFYSVFILKYYYIPKMITYDLLRHLSGSDLLSESKTGIYIPITLEPFSNHTYCSETLSACSSQPTLHNFLTRNTTGHILIMRTKPYITLSSMELEFSGNSLSKQVEERGRREKLGEEMENAS